MIFFVNTLLTDEKNEEIQIKLEEKLISSQGKANDIPNENSIGFNNSQEEMLDGSDHVMSCSTVSNANPASEGDKKLEASLCNPSESVENIVKRNTEEILKDSEWNSPRSDVNVMPVTPRIGPVVIDCNQSDVGTHCRVISSLLLLFSYLQAISASDNQSDHK